MESQPESALKRDPNPDIDKADNTNENENDADIAGSIQTSTFIKYQGTLPHHIPVRDRYQIYKLPYFPGYKSHGSISCTPFLRTKSRV